MTPGFHFQILENFVEVMDHTSDVLLSKLMKSEGSAVDAYPISGLFALDTVCGNRKKKIIIIQLKIFFHSECTMGIKINSQIVDSEYGDAVKEYFNEN